MMTQRKFREQEVQIARYREREVTDPLVASLVHIINLELEADFQAVWETSKGASINRLCERL
jgi:hypothetical protein